MCTLHSSVDAENFLISPTLWSVLFKSLCDPMSTSLPLILLDYALKANGTQKAR
jgi:hypothetical protein